MPVANLIHSLRLILLLVCMDPSCPLHLACHPTMLTALAYHLLNRVVCPIIVAGLLRKVLENSLHPTKVGAFGFGAIIFRLLTITQPNHVNFGGKTAAALTVKHVLCEFKAIHFPSATANTKTIDSIHDEDAPRRASSQSSEDSTEIGSPSSAHSSQLPYDLPAKPLSAIEAKKKHGFYPISWRVIGGGVMMSGKRMSRK